MKRQQPGCKMVKRERRIIALLGRWNLAAEPKFLEQAAQEARAAAVPMPYLLFSMMKRHGSFQSAAMLSASWKTPWFEAPSPKKFITTRSCCCMCMDSAAPTPIGRSAMIFDISSFSNSPKCRNWPSRYRNPIRRPPTR